MELLKGVHVIETYANCALLVDDRLILVDTGADGGAKDVLGYLDRIRRKPTDISTIIITHTHPDHVGGLAVIREKSGAKVASHRIEADYISRKKPYPGPPGIQRHKPADIDILLEDKQRFEEMLVLHTPGHTPGSVSLLDERRKLLIAGDACQTEEGTIGPMDDAYNIDPRMHRESIKRLAQLDFEAIIVGHGKPLATGQSKVMRQLASRL
jgi:glyoxylase-like metal-dependent hydrolase (beta-lactamase superfamily II)